MSPHVCLHVRGTSPCHFDLGIARCAHSNFLVSLIVGFYFFQPKKRPYGCFAPLVLHHCEIVRHDFFCQLGSYVPCGRYQYSWPYRYSVPPHRAAVLPVSTASSTNHHCISEARCLNCVLCLRRPRTDLTNQQSCGPLILTNQHPVIL